MRIIEEFDLVDYNSYRLKSCCAKVFFPETEEDFLRIYREYTDTKKIVIGNGNNIILSKEWYDEYFIILNGCFEKVEVKDNIIIAEAGATMLQLSETALQHSLSGLEIFFDIPSSVGGAVVMNAGASGKEIKDLIIKVRYLDLEDMKIKDIGQVQIAFEYRNSIFQKNTDKIVLKAWFRLTQSNPISIKAKMEDNKLKRWAKQPRNYPNCGSVFKRPKGYFVGTLIDELGLKGLSVGGAQVSEKHSGFIVNKGDATGENILSLIKIIQDKVKSKFGIYLEIEQRIL